MATGNFGRKAWVSLGVLAVGSSVLVAGVALGNTPSNCPTGEDNAVENDIVGSYVCVYELNSTTVFRNREYHLGGVISEPVAGASDERVGTYSYQGNGVFEYTYDGSPATYTGRFCKSNNIVSNVRMLGGPVLNVRISPTPC